MKQLSQQPGNYVPSFYEAHYDDNGDFQGLTVTEPGAPAEIEKCVVSDVEHVFFPTKPIVPNIDIVHNRAVLELFRGCSRGCRFCQAGPGKIAGTPGGPGQTDYRQFRLQ